LTIGHSYVVALNRRLADAIHRAAAGRWEVTAVAPAFVRGDLRPIGFEPDPTCAARVEVVNSYLTRTNHTLVYGRRLRAVLARGWDLIHVWEEPYTFAGGQLAAWAPRRTPLVFSTYQNLSKRYPPPFNWVERAVVRRAAGWIAGGREIEAALLPRPGYAARPHRIIPMAADVERFAPDPAAGAAVRSALGWAVDGPPVVGYLGRFVPEKGVRFLTGVLDRLRSPWRALFVGGGPQEGELQAWAARYADRVRIVTGIPHDRVPAHLNAMDVLAAPSRTTPRWKEQFGRMLVEAFASGVAVAASDSGEIPHVVGDAGVIVGEADESGWVLALDDLLADARRRADLASRGRRRAVERFAGDQVARGHVDFFDDLVAGRPSPGSAPEL
jgi:glycosyltransferase involved in cell wall biosynthesis